jgi:hypothetical protein
VDDWRNLSADMDFSASAEIGAHDRANEMERKTPLDLLPGLDPHCPQISLAETGLAVEFIEAGLAEAGDLGIKKLKPLLALWWSGEGGEDETIFEKVQRQIPASALAPQIARRLAARDDLCRAFTMSGSQSRALFIAA